MDCKGLLLTHQRRKKSKIMFSDRYRYTATMCIFSKWISATHARYYNAKDDNEIDTQEFIELIFANSKNERSITNIIKGYRIPAGTPWYLVDEVYVPMNCDDDFHWVLAVIVLRERLIRLYDSFVGSSTKIKPLKSKSYL